ncbi:MAG: M42 family metallopeptidase [bacterium]
MEKQSVRFLKELMAIPSPSGFEAGVQNVIRERMNEYCDDVTTDVCGNVIGVVNPKAPTRLMLSGHCDEIGFMITYIDDKGFLYFASVGGVDPGIATGQRVRVHAVDGDVMGVIGRKPIHLMESQEMDKQPKLHELWIDIGAKDKKDAGKAVKVGDYVTFDVGFIELRNDLVCAHGFDDRAGAFSVVETLRLLKGRKLKVAVYGVASVQEELGLRGAKTSAYGIDPHIGIAIDVGFATDFPTSDPKRVGECFLGKGPTLHRGPNINPGLGASMEKIARDKKIPFQVTAEPRSTGTDANVMQVNKSGVATALVSIPNRYMHTPVEVISMKDLENTSRLLAEFICSLNGKADYIPRSR